MAVSCMHNAFGIIIGTVRSLWTWLWGRYHVPQNAFLVFLNTWHLQCQHFLYRHVERISIIICGRRSWDMWLASARHIQTTL